MVDRKYVLILCITEALHSETALVDGINKTNLTRQATLDKSESCEAGRG